MEPGVGGSPCATPSATSQSAAAAAAAVAAAAAPGAAPAAAAAAAADCAAWPPCLLLLAGGAASQWMLSTHFLCLPQPAVKCMGAWGHQTAEGEAQWQMRLRKQQMKHLMNRWICTHSLGGINSYGRQAVLRLLRALSPLSLKPCGSPDAAAIVGP
jgi:hypothetical protein